ncbi:MAG: biopolymer transporter ExbD [Muribaculaceae bacterium]|nr:biopolymer transporter ExbD [Muribaculaceae bacterium]
MAEVQQNDGGGKGKNHQKKMTIRVDFTPMVDMNMLLITFFMLCTTMIKSQTLNIALPSNEKVDNVENMSQASADDAITIILDAKRKTGSMVPDTVNGKVVNEVYYFDGKPLNGEAVTNESVAANNNLQKAEFLADEVNGQGIPQARGIRKIIQERNKEVLKKLEEYKKQFRDGKIDQAKYDELAKQVRKDENLKKPVIIIKSTPEASYGALVEILDEMQINSISKYQIDNMEKVDSLMLIDYQNRHHK